MLDLTPRSKIFTLDLSSTRNNEPLPVDNQDSEYLPEVPVLPVDSTEVKETVSEAMISLDISPIKYQLKRKYLDEVSEEVKKKLKQKYRRAEIKFKEKFAEAVAPGQHHEMLQLLGGSDSECDDVDDYTMKSMKAVYDTSDSLSRLVGRKSSLLFSDIKLADYNEAKRTHSQ